MQTALPPSTPTQIPSIPNLYLSSISTATSSVLLTSHSITHILTLLPVRLAPKVPSALGLTHKTIELDDDPFANLLGVLDTACAFISTALCPPDDAATQNRVLVHCHQGMSRSPAVVIAYMMRTLGMRVDEAMSEVRRVAPWVCVNEGFVEQLRLWEGMGCCVVDEDGREKGAYREWKERMERVGEEERRMGMRRCVAGVAARMGRRRMGVEEGE